MKTPETIKLALAHCRLKTICDSRCPYHHEGCGDSLRTDALAYIETLEDMIQMMLLQMRGDCGVCKHRKHTASEVCTACLTSRHDKPNWEYEGLPEMARKENK